MYILGISAHYHDSSAALIKDGKVIGAFEEERFTRKKHDNRFPINSIEACLKEAKISREQIHSVVYYEKPLLKFERILETFVSTYPYSLIPFLKIIPEWLTEKIKIEQKIKKTLNYSKKVYFLPHHLSHAATAFYPSAFEKSAILTIDGVGEYQATGLWFGYKNKIKLLKHIDFPHSLGLLYSAFTAFLGFKVNDDEYKVMGMAAYGKPLYIDQIHEMIDVKNDGSFILDMSYFSYRETFKMWNRKFERLLGASRKPHEPITQRHKDIASSIQLVSESIYIKILNHLYRITKTPNLCIGGGVALNSLANGKIYNNTPFNKIYILGASGDSGGAIGAALHISTHLTKKRPAQINSLNIGNSYSNENIQKVLADSNVTFKAFKTQESLILEAVKLLKNGKIIGWFQGSMEFGPRALGSRSILAAPYPYSMKNKVNVIKKRELFRPFAGSVLEEKASEYFKLPKTQKNFPFMNFCFQVKKPEKIPAITHKDGTCRIQTVNKKEGLYYSLIKEFYRQTNVPVLLNTSFNVKGEPITESPLQAIENLRQTKLDCIIINNLAVYRN